MAPSRDTLLEGLDESWGGQGVRTEDQQSPPLTRPSLQAGPSWMVAHRVLLTAHEVGLLFPLSDEDAEAGLDQGAAQGHRAG